MSILGKGLRSEQANTRKELPPPNWSPTGNAGWWARDDDDENWRWIDDVYGEKTAAEFKSKFQKKQKKQRRWWEVWR